MVKEIRLRCLEELKNDGEFDSLSIILDGCEIMDDVPISLLINNVNSNLNAAIICRINGWQKPSPVRIYQKKSSNKLISSRISIILSIPTNTLNFNCLIINA